MKVKIDWRNRIWSVWDVEHCHLLGTFRSVDLRNVSGSLTKDNHGWLIVEGTMQPDGEHAVITGD